MLGWAGGLLLAELLHQGTAAEVVQGAEQNAAWMWGIRRMHKDVSVGEGGYDTLQQDGVPGAHIGTGIWFGVHASMWARVGSRCQLCASSWVEPSQSVLFCRGSAVLHVSASALQQLQQHTAACIAARAAQQRGLSA